MKKRKKKLKEFLEEFYKILPTLKNQLPTTVNDQIDENICKNSWVKCESYQTNKTTNKQIYKKVFPKEVINCKKIKMVLTAFQKKILQNWFHACTEMYNETLNYVRQNCPVLKNTVIKNTIINIDKKKYVNFINLRKNLATIRDKIQDKTQLDNVNNQNTKIYTHTLDYSIKQLVTNLKSAITNTKNGNFKRFRMKFWKFNRPSQTIDIEHVSVKNNKLCPNTLGTIKYEYNKKPYFLSGITCGVKINYNKIKNEYTLLIPKKNTPMENENKKIISLDPGIRTFMTGLTDDKLVKIGTNVNKKISDKIERLDKIKNNSEIKRNIKKKNEKMINRKIFNMVDDLQWKSISYLTRNYNTILLGDMSAKGIVSKSSKVLSGLQKKACLRTRFYDYNKRLEYKCNLRKVNLFIVNESYTSKTCSVCGNYNNNLKGESVYDCVKCKTKIDRDMNGCRNIFIKSKL